jgi:hypothetical protein
MSTAELVEDLGKAERAGPLGVAAQARYSMLARSSTSAWSASLS